jgi:hypothetical protein
LSNDRINEIKRKLDKGGLNAKSKRTNRGDTTEQDNFLKIRDPTRIGVASKKDRNSLSVTVIYYISKASIIYCTLSNYFFWMVRSRTSRKKIRLVSTVANLLAEWNPLGLVDTEQAAKSHVASLSQIKIISHKEKNDWILVTKYNIGKKHRED